MQMDINYLYIGTWTWTWTWTETYDTNQVTNHKNDLCHFAATILQSTNGTR